MLVDDVQELEDAAVRGRIELEIERPHVIRALRLQPRGGDGGGAEAQPLAPFGRHAQALLAPQALDLPAVYRPSVVAQSRPHAAVAPARMLARELEQASAQRLVTITSARLVALLGAVLAGDRHARRSDRVSRSCSMCTAFRLRDGLTSSLRDLLQGVDLE